MCGICGIAIPKQLNRQVSESRLVAMRDSLTHRGPDDAGLYLGAGVGLGHRRLSIVDLSGGRQPMANEDRRVWIVFNGEIYNHRDLRPELEERGHQYRTVSDTETIVHLYEERGARAVECLSGMFAFAIWDSARRELLLARDRLGIKPLYYALDGDGTLYFASEIKALIEARAGAPEINYSALPDYLANHAPSGEETLFSGFKRLLPGHTLMWRDGRIEVRKYWDLSFAQNGHPALSDRGAIEQWTALFREAVRSHLMADVPLGVFLSGGIDSSAIAAVMSGMAREPIKTFSVGFAEREANELEYARMVARAFNTDHHEVIVSPDDFFAVMPRLIWHEDEPLGHLASVPLYFVSELAARHVKVVLTGEGSDELMAGYYRHWKTVYNLSLGARYYGWTPEALRRAARDGIDRLPIGSALRHRLSRTFLSRTPDVESLYLDNFAVFSREQQLRLLTPEAQGRAGALDPYATTRRRLAQSDATTTLNRLLYADTKTYLHELLMKQDQMSMAASLESRVPFLDHRLVEFTARLPERMKLRRLTTKYVLRRSMKGVLPKPILTRSKMGFPTPVGAWFRGAYRSVIDEYALSARSRDRGVFDPAFVRNLVAEHQSGARDHSQRLWSLVNFEMWARQFIDGEIHCHRDTETQRQRDGGTERPRDRGVQR
ncbi:MAG TPA: asparagine synthase (glutamine-hydrolyzing) [Blastocatellia bacterium]|nr:asparagine synthase (glutamine-hydrolyzing) [Blastocatellia bacterium]